AAPIFTGAVTTAAPTATTVPTATPTTVETQPASGRRSSSGTRRRSLARHGLRHAAAEVGCVIAVAVAVVVGIFRPGAQRTAHAWHAVAGGAHRCGCPAFLHPVDDGAEHVEAVGCQLATLAVRHAGHQEEAREVTCRLQAS